MIILIDCSHQIFRAYSNQNRYVSIFYVLILAWCHGLGCHRAGCSLIFDWPGLPLIIFPSSSVGAEDVPMTQCKDLLLRAEVFSWWRHPSCRSDQPVRVWSVGGFHTGPGLPYDFGSHGLSCHWAWVALRLWKSRPELPLAWVATEQDAHCFTCLIWTVFSSNDLDLYETGNHGF